MIPAWVWFVVSELVALGAGLLWWRGRRRG